MRATLLAAHAGCAEARDLIRAALRIADAPLGIEAAETSAAPVQAHTLIL